MYDSILLPTDGSDGADAALEHAVAQAQAYDATLHVLYVTNTTYMGSGAAEATAVEALRNSGADILAETVESLDERGVDVESKQLEGDPHATIVEYSEDADIDLIVMGTHGRTGLDRYLLGSVTEKVVRTSAVPVLTVSIDDASA